MADEYLEGIMAKIEKHNMRQVAEFKAKNGCKTIVYETNNGGALIEFYNHKGEHMDGSDYSARSLSEAMLAAENVIAACDSNS